jgi:glycosyltransferase involved in cell wall biosynthesis
LKIALVASAPIPSKAANSIQVMKMAQAYKALGHELELFVPRGPQPVRWEDISKHYGLREKFPFAEVPTRRIFRGYDYALAATRFIRKNEFDLVHTRHPQTAAWAAYNEIPTMFELHDLPSGAMGPRLLKIFAASKDARALIVITQALAKALANKYPKVNKATNIQVRPDGIDLQRYTDMPKSSEARKQLKLPEAFTVGYTGHLYSGRGTDLVLELAELLPDIRFLLVGGEEKAVASFRELTASRGLRNVNVVGFVPNADLARYQAASDILIMPYQARVSASSGGDISSFLSPMKMFEYMASSRPILASHLPVFEEVLNTTNAVLLPPDDVPAWSEAIKNIQSEPSMASSLATHARKDVGQYTWEKRVQAILDSLSH